jgi:hypothetical protein
MPVRRSSHAKCVCNVGATRGGGGCARADVVAGSLRHAPCAGTMHPCTRTDN